MIHVMVAYAMLANHALPTKQFQSAKLSPAQRQTIGKTMDYWHRYFNIIYRHADLSGRKASLLKPNHLPNLVENVLNRIPLYMGAILGLELVEINHILDESLGRKPKTGWKLLLEALTYQVPSKFMLNKPKKIGAALEEFIVFFFEIVHELPTKALYKTYQIGLKKSYLQSDRPNDSEYNNEVTKERFGTLIKPYRKKLEEDLSKLLENRFQDYREVGFFSYPSLSADFLKRLQRFLVS